jgi:hypothetical protein
MPKLSLCASGLVAALALTALPEAGSAPAEPAPALAESDRKLLESLLGKDVLGPPVSLPELGQPVTYLAPEHATRSYLRLASGQPGPKEAHRVEPFPEQSPPAWTYRIVGLESEALRQEPNGDLVVLGVNDFKEAVKTRYTPPKPLLPAGLAPGQERRAALQVQVFDTGQPEQLLHSGALDVVVDCLGAFRVKVPAGEFDAILIRSSAHGRIGPAKLDDVQYYFFTAAVGNVAFAQQREVKAFGVYRSTVREARVLADRPALAGAR